MATGLIAHCPWESLARVHAARPTCPPSSSLLLFDIEVEDSRHWNPSSAGRDAVLRQLQANKTKEKLSYLACPRSDFELRLLRDIRAYQQAIVSEEGAPDLVILATKLAAVGYRVAIRTAVGGGPGQACFQNLTHRFLMVAGDMDHQGIDFIIDTAFRDQFEIPQATDMYTEVLRILDKEFVGTSTRLALLVQVLCGEMGAAFEAGNLPCPPWRQYKAMLSKWLPSKVRDVDMGCSSPTSPVSMGKFSLMVDAGLSPGGPLSPSAGYATSPADRGQLLASPPSALPGGRSAGKPMATDGGLHAPDVMASPEASEATSASGNARKLGRTRSLLSDTLAGNAGREPIAQPALDVPADDWQQPIRRVKVGGPKCAAPNAEGQLAAVS